ncbi:restriction endonuclease subunit S [Bradyrhizobium sp. B124]|uniref:restriction endonuclease subunit S n=1 Tax=Bradyrhizobium sp. B124 TaxID=3140245 RepID=UPI003183CD21
MSFGEDIRSLVNEALDPALSKAGSWARIPLGQVATILNGYPWKSKYFDNTTGVALIRIRDVTTGMTETFYNGPTVDGFWIEQGDLLVGMDGDFNLRRWNSDRGLLNQRVCKITTDPDAYSSEFLEYILPPYLRLINDNTSSVTVKHLSSRTLAEIPLPLPPLAEQRRIVAKLDVLTARLADARGQLDRIPALTKQLRKRSVSRAFDGSLTADWRMARGDSKIVTDDALDQAYRIEAGSLRRKPPAEIDWRPSFDIPSSWRWVSIDQVVAQVQYGSSAKTTSDSSGVPVLRMGNIQRGKLDLTDLKYLPRDHDEFPDLLLNEGDVLFNRTNSLELVGKTAVYKRLDKPTSFASYLIRIRPSGVLPELLSAYLNSPFARSWIERVANQQVGQANVNGSKLKALGIPLPPFDEQAEILQRLSTVFAHADHLEAESARARVLLDRMEASILTKAFKGELVPQDPQDEPAIVLLDRIRAQRTFPHERKGRRTGTAPA